MFDEEETHLALRAVLESVAELPQTRAWQSVEVKPSATVDYVGDELSLGGSTVISGPAQHGTIEQEGEYIVLVVCRQGRGNAGVRVITSSVLAAFPPGLAIALPSGARLHIATNPAPRPGDTENDGTRQRKEVFIPWFVHSINTLSS